MTTAVTKESLAARIAELESGARSLKEDYTLAAYKMLLAAMESEQVAVTDDELNAALQLHRLKVDGHSQLSDAFRAGFRYARRTTPQPAPVVPGWIPVSEQTPENKPGSYEYLVFETLNNRVNHDYWNVPDKGDDAFTPFWNYYGEHVTHWMPLPVFTQK